MVIVARKRQRERERYASMSTEKREERNRKQRERREANKNRVDLSAQFATQGEGTISSFILMIILRVCDIGLLDVDYTQNIFA